MGETIAPRPGAFTPIFPLQPIAAESSRTSDRAWRRSVSGSGPCRSSPRELLGRTLPGAQPGEALGDVGRAGTLGAEAGGENYPSELG